MNKLFLELNFGITSFIWPFICILVYKHHIFTPSSDTYFHAMHHLDSTNLVDKKKKKKRPAVFSDIGKFFMNPLIKSKLSVLYSFTILSLTAKWSK